MKQSVFPIVALALGALFLRHRTQSGVGRVTRPRRNIFAEIEELQRAGINLQGGAWSYLPQDEKDKIARIATRNHYKQPASAAKRGEEPAETYYKSLSRQYLKLVNPAIGRIQYPHTTHTIRNSRGDVVLTYNNYDPDKDLDDAMVWFDEEIARTSYDKTVYAIAAGHKWIWKGKRHGGTLLTHGLADELFFTGGNMPYERRAYRALIDQKNGWTMDTFREEYLHNAEDAVEGMHDALMQFNTPTAARNYILDKYYQSFDDGTDRFLPEDAETDLPF